MSYEAWGEPDETYMTPEQAAQEGWRPPEDLSPAMNSVIDERLRQKDVEKISTEHDDEHVRGELAMAASCYAMAAAVGSRFVAEGKISDHAIDETCAHLAPPPGWPFEAAAWKSKSRRENLIRAAALIIAEIERLDRIDMKACEAAAAEIAATKEG